MTKQRFRTVVLVVLLFSNTRPSLAQNPEREAMHDRARQWAQLVRFNEVRPRWLKGADVFRFEGKRNDRATTLVVDCEARTAEPDVEPDWPEVPGPSDAPRRFSGARIPSPDGTKGIANPGGALVLTASFRRRRLADGDTENAWTLSDEPWSPDGRFLAATRTDRRDVYHVPVHDYRDPSPPTKLVPYTKSGGVFPRVELAVFEVETGKARTVDLGEGDFYVLIEGFRLGGRELLVHRISRDAKRHELLAVELCSGAVTVVLTETSETFLGGLEFFLGTWRNVYTPVADGESFLWRSERDGWAHLYLYDSEGDLVRRLTAGEFPVELVAAVDAEDGNVYFYAPTPERPYGRHLWRVPLTGGVCERLTRAEGRHNVWLSPSFRYFVDTHSSIDRPSVSELHGVEGGDRLVLTRADVSQLDELGLRPGEPFVAKAADGKTDLHGVIYVPHDFDPAKNYAVIDYIYGGPWISVVQHDYVGGRMANAARGLAQLGYVVFMVDGRGTPGRNKAFQDANYGIIGQVVVHDHAEVLRQIAATRPWMDTGRVGICGASWGGYFVVKAMFTAPETFHAGVAIVPGDLTEKATINEPNMGLPSQNLEGYRIGAITYDVENFRGALMLAHGTSDVNAPISTTMRVISALVEAGKDHELVILPNQGHGFAGASQRYFERRRNRFLAERLGGPRDR